MDNVEIVKIYDSPSSYHNNTGHASIRLNGYGIDIRGVFFIRNPDGSVYCKYPTTKFRTVDESKATVEVVAPIITFDDRTIWGSIFDKIKKEVGNGK